MVNEQELHKCISEARRFINAANAAMQHSHKSEGGIRYFDYKYTASARRASMDLTRALADLRRSER